ncbi:LysR family transcriptional regulator [Pseudomonas sp. CM25]|uniref:LysR substrate-binding domain-containing protein n=1 Tax=Pseudomonas sp. CM25 TaxID=2738448 RepID=UPI001557CADE|nr:LysR substrate-binding domain-containing protein [Pseudomonas sp. CM25]NQD55792.1 LysR family transcriptional regulator [Pseudomonas sp. CM25]
MSETNRVLPSLAAIKAFLVCAEHGSIKGASATLHKTQGALSKQIKQLEEIVGVELFVRTALGLELTAHGARFAEVAVTILDSYESFVSPSTHSGTIRLSAPSTFTLRWLLPRIDALQRELCGQRLQISSGRDDVPSLKDGSADAVIMRGECADEGLVSFELFPELLTPMCSPEIAKILNQSQALDGQTLLHASPDGYEWSAWFAKTHSGLKPPETSMTFDTLDVALSAAEASMGVVIGDPTLAAERIRSGNLVCPFGETVLSGTRYYLCIPKINSASKNFQMLASAIFRVKDQSLPRTPPISP